MTRRVHIGEAGGETPGAATALAPSRPVIDDWRPLGDSLEWALGRRFWDRRGLGAFLEDGVPFMINADGVAAAAWVELLIGHLERIGRTPAEGACVLEIGTGHGLFARHLLRAVARLSPAWAERLTVVAADASPRMLEDIARRDVLAPFEANCRLVVEDAADPGEALADAATGQGYDAVFLNYVLDTLPFRAVHVRADGSVCEIRVRTVLAGAADPAQLRALATARTPEALDQLLPVRDDLRMELGEFPYAGAVDGGAGVYLLHDGAGRCLDRCMSLLAPGGFVAVRDYPFLADVPERETQPLFQVFGGSTAVGLDFRFLEGRARRRGWTLVAPEEDDEDIRTRILAPSLPEEAVADFRRLFGARATDAAKKLADRARSFVSAGFTSAALDAYRQLLAERPDHWGLHAEAAKLLNTLGDHASAAAVARAGLEANPISPELMSELGDAHFLAGEVAEAHRWFAAICELAPGAPMGHFNISFTLGRQGRHDKALAAVAAGLALDRKGEWRERLLARQAELLTELDRERRREAAKTQDRKGPWRQVAPDA